MGIQNNLFQALKIRRSLRKYSPKTIKAYIYYNEDLLRLAKKSPADVVKDEKDSSASTLNIAINALKFYYGGILKKNIAYEIKRPKKDNQKYLVEDAFKLLNDHLLVPMGPVNHHKDFNIRAHIFLCITGVLFYRYLAWKCKHFHLSLRRLVEELEGILLALVMDNTSSKVKLVVEEMNSKQARLFSQLDMGVYMENR